MNNLTKAMARADAELPEETDTKTDAGPYVQGLLTGSAETLTTLARVELDNVDKCRAEWQAVIEAANDAYKETLAAYDKANRELDLIAAMNRAVLTAVPLSAVKEEK